MDQPVHAVFPRETCHLAVSVFPSATYEIARDADVERAMEATGEDVDVVSIRRHLCCLPCPWVPALRSEEHTSELQSLMRISYAVFCLKKKNNNIAKIVQ